MTDNHISHERVREARAIRREQAGFSWPKAQKVALEKALYRTTVLRTCNPDYQIKYPNECRNLQSCDVKTHVHPEAKKRIIHDQQVRIRKVTPPIVVRPVRLNRTVG